MRDRTQLHLWLIVLGLSLGPAVSNGYARFAYGLLLPAMREDLTWNFTQAGWINTANAIGYLLGSLLALGFISRWGARVLFIAGFALTAAALMASALTRDLWLLSVWRVVAGIGGAPVFIAGGAMASALFAEDKAKNALAIAVYFGGGGLGMLLTGAVLPFMIDWYAVTIWPYAWWLLGLASHLFFLPAFWAALAAPEPAPAQPTGDGRRRRGIPVFAMVPALAAYFMFGVGYIVYITFLIAWMRGEGAGTGLVAGTWGIMGVMVMASPFIWSKVLAKAMGGGAIALTSLAVGAGIMLPLAVAGPVGMLTSAILFGASFFMVPTSTTTFGRKNLPSEQWGPSLALFTTVFSIGQIIGPVGAGMIADTTGSTGTGLALAGAVLFAGALIGILQRPLRSRA
ncbi:MAG: YbfB/YjiJ family MFS transporter [Alphaproteobacteria bacterium]|nr:YbfB/YjiJ family MFS transporter [Alphaproteobacteria bacterium]